MTTHATKKTRRGLWPAAAGKPSATPLTLRQPAPRDWHHDRPAFAGDPYMDWESEPERPKDYHWSHAESDLMSQPGAR